MVDTAIVDVKALSVMVMPDTVGYIAQGVEIDYFAAGETPEDAMERFQKGFVLTVQAHLKKFGSLDRFLKSRESVVKKFQAQKKCWKFSQRSFHALPDLSKSGICIPFDHIKVATAA